MPRGENLQQPETVVDRAKEQGSFPEERRLRHQLDTPTNRYSGTSRFGNL
jgi:hypothetical protein